MTPAPTAFQQATAVTVTGADSAVGAIDTGWYTPAGPNGGYVAAIVVRALEAIADPQGERRLRSLTCHYLRRPDEGPIEFSVQLIRSGRRFSTAQLTGSQAGRTVITALAAFGAPHLESAGVWSPPMPDVLPPPPYDAPEAGIADYRPEDQTWLTRVGGPGTLTQQLHTAPRLGGRPFSGTLRDGHPPESGGWLVIGDAPQPIDAAYVAQCTDAWWPPAFVALTAPSNAATIDLTIHVLADIQPGGLAGQPVLGRYVSSVSVDGLMTEDADLFLPDGTLLAQSRQLALNAPLTRG